MRARIGQIAAGRFNGTKPILAFSEETIDLSVIEGRSEAGSFVIESTNQIKICGIVYSTNPRMECLNPHFEGEKVRIRYQFNSKGLTEGDACEGKFVIVCNQIEYSLSFCARITRLYAEASTGAVKSLDDFTRLAASNWDEAYHLFYNRNFLNTIPYDNVYERLTYEGFACARPSGQNMEEFLIGVNKKQPVSISVDKSEEIFMASKEPQSGCFTITKDNWGYTEIRLRTDCEFIKLSKPVLTLDDFIGKTYLYEYIIDASAMHAGRNFGRIYIDGVYQSFTIDITAGVRDDDGSISDIAVTKDIKECMVGIMELYTSFRLKRIVTGVWANETISILNHLHALVPDEHMYELMKAQAFIINRQRQEAKWILDDFKHSNPDKKAPIWGYYLYLMTLLEREPSYVDNMTHEVELIFYENPDSVLLFWVLLFLRDQYFDDSAGKLKDIKYWVLRGCSSPYLYIEAYYLISQDPYLIKELSVFELRILSWAVKEKALTKELAGAIFEAVDLAGGFDNRVYELLTAAYEICPEAEYVGIICSYLIKGHKNDTCFHKWFELGIENKLRLTGLYESYLITMDDRQISPVPKIIQMYFSFDNKLPYRKLAVLYNNIIAAKETEPEVYHKYRKAMGRFAMDQAQLRHIDDNLAVLYEDMLELGFINEELSAAFSDIIYTHKLIVFDKRIVRAIIYQNEMKEPQIVPVTDQCAYFELFSNDYVILFEDSRGYRYVKSISYRLQRLMDAEKYLDRCISLSPDRPQYIVSHFKHVRDYSDFTKDDLKLFKPVFYSESFSDSYKAVMGYRILKYCQLHDYEDYVRPFLQSINFDTLQKDARKYLIDMLVSNRLYEKAYDMAMEYGIDMLAAVSKVVLCENALKVQHVDDDFMVQLAISAFKTGKYSDLVLKYLCENYTGPTDELINLWHAADKFSISSMKLDERILEQGIYTQIEPEKISDIFMEYYKRAGNEKLILAYISLVAHGYLHSGGCKADFIFDIIEKRFIGNRTLNDACQLALLKHFAEKTDITQAELEIEDTLLKYYIYNNMYFDFFARLDYRLLEKYFLYDKAFLQYESTPGTHVVLHYSRDEDGEEFNSEDMVEMYDGIYVKTFVIFFGELIRYYITEEHDNSIEVKESNRLTCNNIPGDNDHSRYNLINEMIISDTLSDETTLKSNIDEYKRLDAATKQLFKLI
ncbi:DUF5717 family protein [Agathobacter rectalis]|uniref:DUF5717 family protein n=1 Tax=Agathobacter rectalis TaxID=39491 RepID=A0AAW4WLY3_9FIRM|nr:DUF5717 family protein [Agathobacter rectalis]MCC2745685.1 DUF5717 family protein [Agathobacter rectalis]NSI34009.1 hypothetical protein [Agathobacter rectalis]NSI37375.1 hypothetical protein [Agathobacter rectalis]NSI66931.1 hypothetical protein [Agathobacter rectalis]NSI72854.1 hypothetical protein [Agathobacter rectalis]